MQTSFAVKQANDKIIQTLKNIDQLHQDLDDRLERCMPFAKKDEDISDHVSGIYKSIDHKALIDLFLGLSEEELMLEMTSLSRLIQSIPESQNVVISHKAYDKYLDSKVHKDSYQYSALQILKTLYSLPICYKYENKQSLMDYLKRFRYKAAFFKVITQFVPASELDSITKDLHFNFVEYATKVYEYYYEFYSRGEAVDPSLLQLLASLREYEKVDFILQSMHSDVIPTVKFNFSANLSEPIEHLLESLNDFRSNVALVIIDSYEEKKRYLEAPYHILNDYIRDKAGKIVNHEDLSKLFDMWQRMLEVYDMRKSGKSYGQIKQRLGIKDPSKDVKKAEELILSATRGKFPD